MPLGWLPPFTVAFSLTSPNEYRLATPCVVKINWTYRSSFFRWNKTYGVKNNLVWPVFESTRPSFLVPKSHRPISLFGFYNLSSETGVRRHHIRSRVLVSFTVEGDKGKEGNLSRVQLSVSLVESVPSEPRVEWLRACFPRSSYTCDSNTLPVPHSRSWPFQDPTSVSILSQKT